MNANALSLRSEEVAELWIQMPDLYEILGVNDDASTEEIKQGFRQKALECHPDISDNSTGSKEFRRLLEAYEVATCSVQER
jgi:curved DNA-binding protein CbpA